MVRFKCDVGTYGLGWCVKDTQVLSYETHREVHISNRLIFSKETQDTSRDACIGRLAMRNLPRTTETQEKHTRSTLDLSMVGHDEINRIGTRASVKPTRSMGASANERV